MLLSAAIGALRDELMHAVWAGQVAYQLNGRQRTLRFKPAPIEVSLQVAVTGTGTAKAGVKCWLVEAGGEATYAKATTQTVKLTLEPLMFDETGQPVEVLIDAADSDDSATRTGGGEQGGPRRPGLTSLPTGIDDDAGHRTRGVAALHP